MTELKCYGLFKVRCKESMVELVCVSNSVDKLSGLTPYYGWNLNGNKARNKDLVKSTDDNVYPKYLIEEIPYVV